MPNTYQNIAKHAVISMRNAGFEDANIDVRILLGHAANCADVDLIMRANDNVPASALEQFNSFIARRLRHEPIAYIIKTKEFWSLKFTVNEHVLIPRPETEGLVEQALKMIANIKAPNILDVGTGSGAILISLLHEQIDATGLGVDISSDALDVAKSNARSIGVVDRCSLLQSDYFQNVTGKFDLLVSNPPYITDQAMEGLSENVKAYEPALALKGGEDGLTAYRKIIEQAHRFLNSGGSLVFEIGYDQGQAVRTILENAGYNGVTVFKDLAGHDRIICATI